MIEAYLPIFMMIALGTVVAVAMFALTSLLGPKNMTEQKAMPYESGSISTGAKHIRLNVKFYLTAILFVVFDIEAVFMYHDLNFNGSQRKGIPKVYMYHNTFLVLVFIECFMFILRVYEVPKRKIL